MTRKPPTIDPQDQPSGKPSPVSLISYLIAAAILLPVGWWLKANYAKEVGHQILTLGGLLD